MAQSDEVPDLVRQHRLQIEAGEVATVGRGPLKGRVDEDVSLDDLPGHEELKAAGLLDPRAQPPIFRPEEPDLPLEAEEDEADEPLAADETGR